MEIGWNKSLLCYFIWYVCRYWRDTILLLLLFILNNSFLVYYFDCKKERRVEMEKCCLRTEIEKNKKKLGAFVLVREVKCKQQIKMCRLLFTSSDHSHFCLCDFSQTDLNIFYCWNIQQMRQNLKFSMHFHVNSSQSLCLHSIFSSVAY